MRAEVEQDIQALRDAGDLHAAATRAIDAYGPEVLGFLVTYLRDETDAADVFSQTSEDLWTGLPRFEGRASLRTWLYTLGRHAAARFQRSPHRADASLSRASTRLRKPFLSIKEDIRKRARAAGHLPE